MYIIYNIILYNYLIFNMIYDDICVYIYIYILLYFEKIMALLGTTHLGTTIGN